MVRGFLPSAVLAASLAVSGLLLQAPVARAQDRVAGMVLELTGTTEPTLAPFSELAERSTLSLAPDARVTFVHYGTCRLVTVAGGKIYVDKARYSVTGGKVEHEEKTNCPREQRMSEGATGARETGAAALVLRDAATPPEFSGHPALVLTGPRGDSVRTAVLRRADKEVGALVVTGHSVQWPKDRPALAAGEGYVLLLSDADHSHTISVSFSVVASPVFGESPMVLRLE